MADSDLAERYRFAPDDLAAARAASRPDNWHGPLEAVEHRAWIAIWCAASVLTWRYAPWWLAVPVYVVAVFFIGAGSGPSPACCTWPRTGTTGCAETT